MSDPSRLPSVESDPAELGFDAARLGRIDSLLGRYVDDGRIPGWSVLVSRHGQPAHIAAGGQRDVEAGAPVELDTIFRIYSMTKPVTSVAAMMLCEQGAFELTDPIAKWLPEFADMRVWDGGSDLKPKTVPALEPIRVWHLLTHTSGLTYGFHHAHPVDAMYRAAGYEWGAPPSIDLAGASEAFASMPLLFHPGCEWNYSVSTDVLGRLVEVVSGQSLDAFFAEHIFTPLGMTDTGFGGSDPARTAALYTPGLLRADAMGDSVLKPSWFSGGGGLTSTLGDYHRFTQMLLGRGRLGDVRLLGDRTVPYMASNHLPGGADLVAFGRPLFAETPFDGVGFGLGFSVTLDPAATRTLSSRGEFAWGGAASTAFWVDPVENITVVFMTQLLPSSTYPIRSQLRQLVYSALVD
ncbi:MAG TPA: serine hydrolase domain-containing protein [Jatrophihabitans sp.]|uniref:serine hydrolase domain-containing protein n=1 Tax=Jatrophihabitans sp. TaxID=1932789 RepID=UPI002E0097E0|nr:serine hydrolase domain-containing protein [Jatrophihabitans sp.]